MGKAKRVGYVNSLMCLSIETTGDQKVRFPGAPIAFIRKILAGWKTYRSLLIFNFIPFGAN